MSAPKIADFEAPSTAGTFRLSDQKGKKLVLYFYPKDNTPGCTTEGAAFRDLHDEFARAGAMIAGVSRDSLKSHESFKSKMGFPFELISDADEVAVPTVRRHQDEEHVRQEGPRHRALDVPDRRRREARPRMARRQGSRSRRGSVGRRPVAVIRAPARIPQRMPQQRLRAYQCLCPRIARSSISRARASDARPRFALKEAHGRAQVPPYPADPRIPPRIPTRRSPVRPNPGRPSAPQRPPSRRARVRQASSSCSTRTC